MKYVRTKDGRIIEIPNKHKEIVYDGNVIISLEKIINGVRGEAIVNGIVDKKADTIEELCDEFVVCFDSKTKPVRVDNSMFLAKHYAGKSGHIMCAIWTDKGLIYVAKMNYKGEFELL